MATIIAFGFFGVWLLDGDQGGLSAGSGDGHRTRKLSESIGGRTSKNDIYPLVPGFLTGSSIGTASDLTIVQHTAE